MIGWRYHLISIVAVFLALGLGLLMGTALLNDNLVSRLQRTQEDLQADLIAQQDELRTLANFANQVLPYATQDRLFGEEVVVVTHPGVDEAALSEARRALDLAGASVRTTLTIQEGLVTASPPQQRVLEELLGLAPGTSPDEVLAAAGDSLSQRLAAGAGATLPEEDLLARFLSEGFIVATDPAIVTTEGVGGPGQAFVFVVGGAAEGAAGLSDALLSLIGGIGSRGMTVAVAEPTISVDDVVARVRSEVDATGPVVTVDDLDLPAGGAALVLGLERAVRTGQGGHYGMEEGAEQLLPPPA